MKYFEIELFVQVCILWIFLLFSARGDLLVPFLWLLLVGDESDLDNESDFGVQGRAGRRAFGL